MNAFLLFMVLLIAAAAAVTLGSLAIIFDFVAKSKGLKRGMTQKQLEELQRDIAAIRKELETIREQQADLTLMLDELPRDRLSGDRS